MFQSCSTGYRSTRKESGCGFQVLFLVGWAGGGVTMKAMRLRPMLWSALLLQRSFSHFPHCSWQFPTHCPRQRNKWLSSCRTVSCKQTDQFVRSVCTGVLQTGHFCLRLDSSRIRFSHSAGHFYCVYFIYRYSMKNMLSWNFKQSPLRDLFTYVRHSFQSVKELLTQKLFCIKGNIANVCSSESVYSHEKNN